MKIFCEYSEYFLYLLRVIGIDDNDILVQNLIRMFEREYYWKNPIDSSITGHVDELRANAMRYGGVNPTNIPNRPVSVLETLVSISILIDLKLLYDEENPGGNVGLYFMDLVEELGFDCDKEGIDSAIDDFLDGKRRISNLGETLWQQCNNKFSDYFDIMTGDE